MARSTLEAIKSRLRSLLPELRERHGITALWILGSQARGDAGDSSDLDLLVEFDERACSLWDCIGLQQEIEDYVGLKVDLVDRKALRREIVPSVLKEAVLV